MNMNTSNTFTQLELDENFVNTNNIKLKHLNYHFSPTFNVF